MHNNPQLWVVKRRTEKGVFCEKTINGDLYYFF